MASYINHKNTLFEWAKLTSIRGKPTFKMLHNILNKIKANTKAIYSNLREGSHSYISLVITDCEIWISNIPFVNMTHPGMLIIPDSTTDHANSNIRIVQTEKVLLFRKVMRIEQALVQKIVATVEDSYLADIHNFMTNSINNTVADVLNHLKDNYGHLMTRKLLKRE